MAVFGDQHDGGLSMMSSDDILAELEAWETGQSSLISSPCADEVRFTGPRDMAVTPSYLPMNQSLSGPSHQYDRYRQQTPLVPGAATNTMAMNEGLDSFGFSYDDGSSSYGLVTPQNPMLCGMGLDFENPTTPSQCTPSRTIDPLAIEMPTPLYRSNADERVYPGVHQHNAAMARARSQAASLAEPATERRPSAVGYQFQQTNPVIAEGRADVETVRQETISHVIGVMRSQPSPSVTGTACETPDPGVQSPHPKKDEEEMDEDERFLNSEEGKKLSPKERRQLRNKVSARAFRTRRKEYMTTMEAQLARVRQEQTAMEEKMALLQLDNERLLRLTTALLQSKPFSHYMTDLVTDTLTPAQVSLLLSTQQPNGADQFMQPCQHPQLIGQQPRIPPSTGQHQLGPEPPVNISPQVYEGEVP